MTNRHWTVLCVSLLLAAIEVPGAPPLWAQVDNQSGGATAAAPAQVITVLQEEEGREGAAAADFVAEVRRAMRPLQRTSRPCSDPPAARWGWYPPGTRRIAGWWMDFTT